MSFLYFLFLINYDINLEMHLYFYNILIQKIKFLHLLIVFFPIVSLKVIYCNMLLIFISVFFFFENPKTNCLFDLRIDFEMIDANVFESRANIVWMGSQFISIKIFIVLIEIRQFIVLLLVVFFCCCLIGEVVCL